MKLKPTLLENIQLQRTNKEDPTAVQPPTLKV